MLLQEFLNTFVDSGTYIAIVDGINAPYYEGRARGLRLNRYGNYTSILQSRVIEVYAENVTPGTLIIFIATADDVL